MPCVTQGTHTVRYAGVLATASSLRPRIVPKPPVAAADDASEAKPKHEGRRYRSCAELLGTLGIVVASQPAPIWGADLL